MRSKACYTLSLKKCKFVKYEYYFRILCDIAVAMPDRYQ